MSKDEDVVLNKTFASLKTNEESPANIAVKRIMEELGVSNMLGFNRDLKSNDSPKDKNENLNDSPKDKNENLKDDKPHGERYSIKDNQIDEKHEEPIKTKTEKRTPNIHKDHRQRLKKQFSENGISSLTDIQKLELLLFYAIPQKDTNPIAHELLSEMGSLKNVFSADIRSLCNVAGIKESSAILINLVGQMYNFITMPEDNETLSSTRLAKEFCKKLFVGAEVEEFYVICLTKSNKVKKYKLIQTGTTDEVNIQIRTITEFAIATKSNRIIVAHNHPAGIGAVSDEDYKFTYALVCSCLLNTIELIDHIIVGVDASISMHSQGTLSTIKHKAYERLQIPVSKVDYLSSLSENYEIEE